MVSYHSLDDRQVKLSFRERRKNDKGWVIVTPKPIRPSVEEVRSNPRSRSARLRALEALGFPLLDPRTGFRKEKYR